MSGLFSTFNVATRGMSAQQKSIDVTSHNIANANTEGYSRQRALIQTTKPFGMPSLNNVAEPGQLGTGAQVSAIERYRDAFLDYQTRVETSTKGQYDARQTILGEVESIFNEPSDTGLSTVMGKFFDSWQQLSKQPESSNARTVVVQQSASLADSLNHLYKKLSDLKVNTQEEIRNSVVDMNSNLQQIDALNQQIVGVTIAGNRANDLMDKRDLLLDKLSSQFNLSIEPKQFDGINIKPVDTGTMTDPYIIKSQNVGGASKFSYINSIVQDTSDPTGKTYTITYNKLGDQSNSANTVTMTVTNVDAAAFKSLDESRVLWSNNSGDVTDKDGNVLTGTPGAPVDFNDLVLFQPSDGELKGYESSQKDLDDYMDQLNKLAKVLAFSVNAVHSGIADPLNPTTGPTQDSMPFFVNSDVASYDSSNILQNLGNATSGVLFSEKDITAANISINKEILSDPMKIKTRTHDDQFDYESFNNIDGESDGARAQAIAGLRDSLITIQDVGTTILSRKDLFTAGGNQLTNNGLTFGNNTSGMKADNYFKDVIDRVGIQSQEAQRMVKNQDALLSNFDESRASISGVSLDEEMANLIQYQHAYQANAKVISTVDQLLDVVVNGLKK